MSTSPSVIARLRQPKFAKVGVEALEALLPVPSVLAEPVGDVAERFRLQATGSPLSLPPLLDESGALEHLKVLRDRRKTKLEWSRQFRDGGLTVGQPREDGPPSWIRQGGEGGAEVVGSSLHFVFRSRYYGGEGDTLDYVYELVDDTLTVWGGERGSPAYFRGTFDDRDSLTGAWVWPGGGYQSRMTRTKEA